jgi:hypothetical protein
MQGQRPGVRILLAKLDVTRAFRQCPLPIREFRIAAHRIGKVIMLNTRLMMGATASGDSMAAGISMIRDLIATQMCLFSESYIDDMLLVMYEDEADAQVAAVVALWEYFGWPINPKKLLTEGKPATSKVFLGILINTITCIVSVPAERVTKLEATLTEWIFSSTTRTPRALSRLAGSLQFIAPIIPFGRVFLRSLYRHGYKHSLESQAPELAKSIHDDVRLDLQWWLLALIHSNGSALFKEPASAPVLHIYTDAAGSGWGAVFPAGREYASGTWSRNERYNTSTAHWEGAAIVLACRLWGPLAQGGTIVLHSDSMACVSAFTNHHCTDDRMYLLLRMLSLLQMQSRFRLIMRHIPGSLNVDADHLSRYNKPTVAISNFTRRTVSSLTAINGTLMSSKLLRGPSRVANHLGPLCLTLTDIVRISGIQSQHTLLWTPWNSQLTAHQDWDDCSISLDGCGTSAIFPQLPHGGTSLPSVRTFTRCVDGDSWNHLYWRNFCCVKRNAHLLTKSVSDFQQRSALSNS